MELKSDLMLKSFLIAWEEKSTSRTKIWIPRLKKKISEEIWRKTSGSSLDTACSYEDNEIEETKLPDINHKELSPLVEASLKHNTMGQSPLQLTCMSLSDSPIINPLENQSLQKATRKMPIEDILQTNFCSLSDFFLSKIKAGNNKVIYPKLSDLVDISSSYVSTQQHWSFEQINNKNKSSNSSFRLHQRKASSNDLLATKELKKCCIADRENLFELDFLTKKFKAV